MEDDRPRRLVRLAAAEKTSASAWLLADENGTWETEARRLLTLAAEKHPDKTAAEVDTAIAEYLKILALRTLLADAKKNGKK